MRIPTFTLIAGTLIAGLGLAFAGYASADDDQERALGALRAGEIVPLRDILSQAERDFDGEMIEVELEREDGRWIYEIKLLAPGGRVMELEYDARTKALLETEEEHD